MKESQIEAKLVRMVRDRGGLCYKFVSPGNPGVPDRLILLPGGRVVFAELKTEVGRLANIQKWQLEELRKRGAEVRVLKGMEQVEAFYEEMGRGTAPSVGFADSFPTSGDAFSLRRDGGGDAE